MKTQPKFRDEQEEDAWIANEVEKMRQETEEQQQLYNRSPEEKLAEALQYIAGHARMASTLANDAGRLAALDNILKRAEEVLAEVNLY